MLEPEYEPNGPVYWFITVGKIDSWTFSKFRTEYTVVHAEMTAAVAKQVPAIRDYTQVLVEFDSNSDKFIQPRHSNEGWHALTIHIWSSLKDLHESFADVGYQQSAGKHIFCRLDQNGCFAKLSKEVVYFTGVVTTAHKARILVFHRKSTSIKQGTTTESDHASWLTARYASVTRDPDVPQKVMRYRQYTDCTPESTVHFFHGTQFSAGNWKQFFAVEEFLLPTMDEAASFLNSKEPWFTDETNPLIISGWGYKVFGQD